MIKSHPKKKTILMHLSDGLCLIIVICLQILLSYLYLTNLTKEGSFISYLNRLHQMILYELLSVWLINEQ